MGCVSSSAAQKPGAGESSRRMKSSTPIVPKRELTEFEKKLERVQSNDPALRHFKACWGDDITEDEAIQLLAALERNEIVKSVEFCSNSNLGIRFCETMGKLLQANHEFAIVSLRDNPNFGDEGIIALCRGLERNRYVLDFKIDGCGFGDAGAARLKKLLSYNRKLFRLDVSGNGFSSAGLDSITEGVIENGRIGGGLLQLTMNPLESYDYAAAQAVEAAMLQNKRCMFVVPDDFEDQFNFEGINKERKHLYDARSKGLRTKYVKLF